MQLAIKGENNTLLIGIQYFLLKGIHLCPIILLLVGLMLIPGFGFSQKIKPMKTGKLPKVICESSGTIKADSVSFWTMNDSGGENDLYLLDTKGNLLRTLTILNATNHDWEDLTEDESSAYIGDFGNNTNRRQDLKIYKVSKKQLSASDSVKATIISFNYQDQKSFPPPPSNWNFDCEAFFHFRDSLFLFSKNLSNPNDGFTKLYVLPDHPGNYVARLVDSLPLKEPVTGAAISPDEKTIVLLTYFSLWVIKDFDDHHFFEGKIYQVPFKGLTQKEGIAFMNENLLLLTDERHLGKGGKIYEVDLSKLQLDNPQERSKIPFLKKTIYNAFNNPKAAYKRVMKKEAAQ